MKHTPGPWSAENQGMNPSDYDIEIRTQDGSRLIASVHEQYMASMSNARLMAAAPEMYEALVFFNAQLPKPGELTPEICVTMEMIKAIAMMRLAIEKAKGER